MSKFNKKLDQARQTFFSGGRNAGKKMKHDAAGNLDDDQKWSNIPSGLVPATYRTYYPITTSNLSANTQQQLQAYQQQMISSIINAYGNGSYICNCSMCLSRPIFVNAFIDECPRIIRDPNYNNDFGWRCWSWCTLEKKLYSPIQNVLWPQAENHAHKYDESSMVRGVAGIHARFVPENWEELECPDGIMFIFKGFPIASSYSTLSQLYGKNFKHRIEITGLVERFGKFVEGTEGWRSEWAIIRKLYAPTTEIGLSLEQAFPEVEVIYAPPMEHPNPIKFDINPNNY